MAWRLRAARTRLITMNLPSLLDALDGPGIGEPVSFEFPR
jgi:hypothetical protein